MLIDRTVSSLLDAFSSADPTPGGGSAAALAGATGAALLVMVTGMPKSRTNAIAEREALDAAHAELVGLRDALAGLIDRDAAAYDLVVAAFRKPKGTDEEKAERKAAIQAATRAATEAPLDVMRASVAAMRHGEAACLHGNPSAASDAKVGMRLLHTAAQGANDNVNINLGGLADEALRSSMSQEASALLREADVVLNARC